jgi:hypothetical protein
MQESILWQQVAGLHLGEISVDDFLEYLTNSDTASPEQIAIITALLRKYGVRGTKTIEGPDLEALLRTAWYGPPIVPQFTSALFERTWRELLVAPNRNDLNELWTKEASAFRSTPEFSELVRGLDLPAYWDLYGWPDICRPVGASGFACD